MDKKYLKEFGKGFVPFYAEYSLIRNHETDIADKIAMTMAGAAHAVSLIYPPSYAAMSMILGFHIADEGLELRIKNNEVVA